MMSGLLDVGDGGMEGGGQGGLCLESEGRARDDAKF
jgi:hypothetical protein